METKNDFYQTWFVTTSTSNVAATNPYVNNGDHNKQEKNLIYGLQALADFLHQSVTSAWRLKKNPKYKSAFMQKGRCVITDVDKLLELMSLENEVNQVNFTSYYNY